MVDDWTSLSDLEGVKETDVPGRLLRKCPTDSSTYTIVDIDADRLGVRGILPRQKYVKKRGESKLYSRDLSDTRHPGRIGPKTKGSKVNGR